LDIGRRDLGFLLYVFKERTWGMMRERRLNEERNG